LFSEILGLEQPADLLSRSRRDDDGVRLGQRLQASGEVGGFADRGLLLRLASSDRLSYDHQSRRNTNAHPHAVAQGWRLADRSDDRKCTTDRPFGVRFSRLRPTKVDQHAITDISGDEAIELCNC